MEKKKTVLALGFFDGIHIGHGALLETAKKRAEELGASAAVLTFDAHPDTYVKGEKVELINSASDRIYIIRKYYGINDVYFIHFNAATMRMEWQAFIESVIQTYNAVHFVVGHDFRFGYKGAGKAEVLQEYCREKGLGCDIIPAVSKEGIVVSSTYIRKLLSNGEMERVCDFLGHPHVMSDSVRTGFRLGRKLEAPTVNMLFQSNVLVPKHGVYASRIILEDGIHDAVTNIGVRPTFNGKQVTVETNILGFEGDLYGKKVCLEFYSYIRPEKRFDSPEELVIQIKKDAEQARAILGRI